MLMLYSIFVITLGTVVLASTSRSVDHVDPEVYMTTCELIRHQGYPAEAHWVTTDDGYILALHRITGGRGEKVGRGAPKPVVFLQHGLLDSSATWVLNLPHESFGFMLADSGFDVWMGNVRGNTYSKNHTTLKINSDKFWDFSFDEMAHFDLPSMLNYVMKHTGISKMAYFGHSQGTEMAFIEFSRNKKLAQHITLYGALAPVARISHVGGLFKLLNKWEPEIVELFHLFGIRDFVPSDWLIRELAVLICPIAREILCSNILFLISGWDRRNLNETRIPIYYSHTPAGTSVRNIVHWSQMIKAQTLQAYDYGSAAKNQKHYNQSTPPPYDVSTLEVPTVLIAGGNDFLGDPRDVAWLEGQIAPEYIIANMFFDTYSHMDFVWGMSSGRSIYQFLINLLNKQLLTF